MNGKLTRLRLKQRTAGTDNVTQIPFFKLIVINTFWQAISCNVQLNTATDILQRYKGGFPHDTTGHHSASNRDFNV
ncbi:Uncharacterised protein [Shigella sonnei]|nr:Uncharacterised protein [Shigella sonnei]CSG38059.1 Uncharacterised protein [Shigella sonnei]